MIYTNFSHKLRTGVRLFLFLLLVITALFIVVTAAGRDGAQEPVTASVEKVDTNTESVQATTEPVVVLNADPILFPEYTYQELFDIKLCTDYTDKVSVAAETLTEAIDSGNYTSEAIHVMEMELTRLYTIISYVEADIRHYTTQEQEYYYAAKTWQFFRQRGYSAEVTSAIIGNMMIETSGGSLSLKPEIYSSGRGFYGLCQWSLYYKPFMADKTFEEQLVYLDSDMQSEFDTFGPKCYKSGFKYDDFLAMDDPAQAALAFAKTYERCGSGSYGARKQAARVAYDYFTKGVRTSDGD